MNDDDNGSDNGIRSEEGVTPHAWVMKMPHKEAFLDVAMAKLGATMTDLETATTGTGWLTKCEDGGDRPQERLCRATRAQ